MDLYLNEKFDSYQTFEEKLTTYQQSKKKRFVIAGSQRAFAEEDALRFKYRFIRLVCKQGRRRHCSVAVGIRAPKGSCKVGCPAVINVRLNKPRGKEPFLKVTKLLTEHECDDVQPTNVSKIKQRQQNSLVQREQSKSKENTVSFQSKKFPGQKAASSDGASSKSPYQPTIKSYNAEHSNGNGGKRRAIETFDHWKETREGNWPDGDNDTMGIESDAEMNIAEHPIDGEEFGTLADKIANRVKQSMGIHESHSSNNASGVETLNGGSSFHQPKTEESQSGNSPLASHHCSVCKELLSSSKHIPLMIIPCGHTMCKACANRKPQCPECGCSVVSLTVNIMLQQVIQEYYSHNQGASPVTLQTSPLGTLSGISSVSSNPDNLRNKTTSYQSQLANLHSRQSILLDEQNELQGKVTSLNKLIQQTSSQSKSTAKQEHEVMKALVELQDKLAALETHRKQYETQLTELYDEKFETEGKITLLSGTLDSLTRELEKVKQLADGEEN